MDVERAAQVAEQVVAAINGRDPSPLLAVIDPDFEGASALVEAEGGRAFRGVEGAKAWFENLVEVYGSIHASIEQTIAVSDQALHLVRLEFVGKSSGVALEAYVAWVIETRRGRIVFMHSHLDLPAAFYEVGRRLSRSQGSGGNVELQRRAVEAFHARDVDAFIAGLDPDVEYHSVMTVPGGAVYHGHDGVRKYFEDFRDAWGDDFRVEPEVFFDLGEHTLMYYSVHGLGQHSGAGVAMPGAQVCRWRNGLMVYGRAYADRGDALRDLGVSEAELEPIPP